MAKIFISHSSKDKPFAIELKRRLESKGHDAWLDLSELLVGDEIRTKIDEGIERSDVVVFVLSPDAILSRWFNYELRVAQTLLRSGKKRPLFPVLLRECTNLPPDLEGVRFADFRRDHEQGWKELEQGLSQWERVQQPSSPHAPPSRSEPAQPPISG
ncbi:toll/interleukin-1 receptor domain-containing protein, partial [Archangium violaceum]